MASHAVSGTLFREAGWRDASASHLGRAFGALGLRADGTDLAVTFQYAGNRIQQPGSLPLTELRQDRTLNFTGGDFFRPRLALGTLNLRQELNENVGLSVNAFGRGLDTEQFNANLLGDDARAFNTTTSFGGTLQLTIQGAVAHRPNRLVVGLDYVHHDVRVRVFEERTVRELDTDVRGRQHAVGIYLEDTLELAHPALLDGDSIVLTAATRWDWLHHDIDDESPATDRPRASGTSTFSRANPRLGLNYNLTRDVGAYARVTVRPDSFIHPPKELAMELDRRDFLRSTAAMTLTLAVEPAWAQTTKAEVLWLGQAATKITTLTGKVIVVDPFLVNNPKTPPDYKNLDKLGKVDVILVTHGHGDHTGDVKDLAARTSAKVFGPAGLVATMIDLGWVSSEQGVRFGKGGTVTPLGPSIKITQVRAEHSSEVTVTDPATKKSTTYPGGEPAGFVIELENGFKLYHMGDTGLFGDMRLIADYYKPDLVMIPIGGHFVMDPRDAAYATREMLKPRYAIPIHYGTFPVLRGTPQEYQQFLGQTTTQVFPISPGDRLTF